MKLNRKRDLNSCGIYAIVNTINNKVYVGKSVNIYERIRQHINKLNKSSKDSNLHLNRSWLKYGRNAFEYKVLELVDRNEALLKERELYWINELDSTNRDSGYNLRVDSETKCILPQETRDRMSKSRIEYYKDNSEARAKTGRASSKFWKDNPQIKNRMAQKVSKAKQQYKFEQYDKDMNLIKVWSSIKDIISHNPDYKWNNIYAVCNGYKPTIYGYIWRKIKI